MEFETVEHGGRIHVVRNGVESGCFVIAGYSEYWVIYCPILHSQYDSLGKALEIIGGGMDRWYTVSQAAEHLVELGKVAKPPAAQTMYRWLLKEKFPGSVRCGRGRGGGWRIPGAALREFTKRGGERK